MNRALVLDGQAPRASRGRVGTSPIDGRLVGGKGARLVMLRDAGQPVPEFYCVTTAAFQTAYGRDDQAELAQWREGLGFAEEPAHSARIAEEIRRRILSLPWPAELEESIAEMHRRLFGEETLVAVRSSMAGEDGFGRSFAGMYDSLLNIQGWQQTLAAMRRVMASAFSDRVIAYRRKCDMPPGEVGVALIVQRMVAASASGVMFTCHPVTGNVQEIAVAAVAGTGQALVSGDCPGEMCFIDKPSGNVQRAPAPEEDPAARPPTETTAAPPVNSASPLLTEENLKRLREAGLAIENHFGRPQDIEFCFDDRGTLWIVQARDVVNPAEYGPAAGNHCVWDNSNIIESYSGTTTPMTFSFIRRAYSIVYHCFAQVMGISPRVVHANRDAFENMLGLFRGRVYYNLKNWYRLVRLFPGYEYNRRFMESMMGLKKPLDDNPPPPSPGLARRWLVELPALLRLLARSAWNFLRIETIVGRFQAHFDKHHAEWSRIDFKALKPHEIHALYRHMEEKLLWNWKAPIINDFYVMVFHGILRKLCTRWCHDESGALANALVCGDQHLESAEPARALVALANCAQRTRDLEETMIDRTDEELPEVVLGDQRFAEFSRLFADYLDDYGLRCVDELKLESKSLRDRPHLVFRMLRGYLAAHDPALLSPETLAGRQRQMRDEAEQRARSELGRHSWRSLHRKWIFGEVLKNARRGIRQREMMRFARTRIYGILREMLRALGENFEREGILDEAAHMFYLTIDEVWDFVQGTAVSTDLNGLAVLRSAEYDRYQREELPAPGNRFDTYGMAYHRNQFQPAPAGATLAGATPAAGGAAAEGAFLLQGIGCCPGIVTAPVAVVTDPTAAPLGTGSILVAERTDPGWVPIYPAFSGILIERGSLLSHSAIVAREMGIPTIVGLTGLMARIRDGQVVTMNGETGLVAAEGLCP
jgi:rifampicin phosphotransferase